MHLQAIFITIHLSIALVLAAVLPQHAAAPKTELAKSLPRIIGGHPVPDSRFNFVARITVDSPGSESLCSGSLIAPTVILTAAHCLIDESGMPATGVMRATFGYSHTSPGESFYIQKVYIHPQYDAGVRVNDIGLVILNQGVPSGLAAPAKIYTGGYNESTVFTVAGYGLTKDSAGPPSDTLLQTDLAVGDKPFCEHSYPPWNISSQICLAHNNGRDACEGDSGGPAAVHDINGNIMVLGVTSFGAGVASGKAAGYYTDASKYTDWVSQSARGEYLRPYGGNAENDYLSEFVKSISVSGINYINEDGEHPGSGVETRTATRSSGCDSVKRPNTHFLVVAISLLAFGVC
ncbi:trypsin-like serine protease [Linderina pennispora]|uniref:Trypsin-like serine protease n=1 Tax=Linderina pennispora TaxID=61395 RepID=A0A1Y1VXN0_9FUNG|nr:trypsin-like serine protease [Linderina pennispora]ORX65953.1 trypsin-like serine protease [Linderina pennispora]